MIDSERLRKELYRAHRNAISSRPDISYISSEDEQRAWQAVADRAVELLT